VHDLPLQIREIDDIAIHKPNGPDPGGRQIEPGWRAETAGTDQQDLGPLELELPLTADILKNDVSAVALDFLLGEFHGMQLCSG